MKGDGYSVIRRIVAKRMSKTPDRARNPFVVAVRASLANSELAAENNMPLMPK